MQIGVIGRGRMGAGIAKRLLEANHAIVGFDISPAHVEQVVQTGAAGARSLQDLASQLTAPRALWVMVPHGDPTHTTIEELLPLLTPDDVIVDGGNSRYTDSVAHATHCREQGVYFLDVGVSGGVRGLAEGFNLMIGGPQEAFRRLEPVFRALAPPEGYAHVGPSGAGHFVKMIHNAIEYAMLQALGEGFECLERSEFNLDLTQIAGLWEHGAVVRSWLLDLLGRALKEVRSNISPITWTTLAPGVGPSNTHWRKTSPCPASASPCTNASTRACRSACAPGDRRPAQAVRRPRGSGGISRGVDGGETPD